MIYIRIIIGMRMQDECEKCTCWIYDMDWCGYIMIRYNIYMYMFICKDEWLIIIMINVWKRLRWITGL